MLTPSQTGVVLIAEPVVQALFSPLAGRLSDRYEPRIISSIGMALNVAGLIPLIFIHSDTSIHYIVICLIILGIGFALFSSPNVNATMSSVENKFYGIASATLSTMRLVGQMFSMGITMLVFAVIIGTILYQKPTVRFFSGALKLLLLFWPLFVLEEYLHRWRVAVFIKIIYRASIFFCIPLYLVPFRD